MNAATNISAQSFGSSKNYPTFVVSSPKTFISIFAVAAIFYAPYSAQAGNYGYQIPANCCTAKSVIVFGETGGDSLSYIRTASFHSQMPKTMKSLKADARGVSASTVNARKRVTSICAKVAQKQSKAKKDLEVTQKLPTFVVPRNVKGFESTRYISNRLLDKAGLLSDNSTSVVLRFLAETEWRLASFCTYIPQIFGQKMPRNDKNLKADARGVSASTVNARKRVTSTRISRSVSDLKHPLYEVEFELVDRSNPKETCRYEKVFEASSQEEALGLAVLFARKKHRWHNLALKSISATVKLSPSKA